MEQIQYPSHREPTAESGVCPWDDTPAGNAPGPTNTAGPTVTSSSQTGTTSSQTSATTSNTGAKSSSEDSKGKPSIAIASTSEDIGPNIAPWILSQSEDPKEKTLDVIRSRKNSSALDSGSSSSEISLAIVEVSDRLRRTIGITQQNTLDDSKLKGRKLSTSIDVQRRSSISIPPKYSEKPSLRSFEENTGSCTLLTTEISNNLSDKDNKNDSRSLENTCAPIISVSSVLDDSIQELSTDKEVSITSEMDTVIEAFTETSNPNNSNDVKNESKEQQDEPKGSNSDLHEDEIKLMDKSKESEGETSKDPKSSTKLELTLAPLAVPDSESPCSEFIPEVSEVQDTPQKESTQESIDIAGEEATSEDKDTKTQDNEGSVDSKQKEICPWEDE